jgi:hypothetical protein
MFYNNILRRVFMRMFADESVEISKGEKRIEKINAKEIIKALKINQAPTIYQEKFSLRKDEFTPAFIHSNDLAGVVGELRYILSNVFASGAPVNALDYDAVVTVTLSRKNPVFFNYKEERVSDK